MSVMLRIAAASCHGQPGQVSTCTGDWERDEAGDWLSSAAGAEAGGGEGGEITYGENRPAPPSR